MFGEPGQRCVRVAPGEGRAAREVNHQSLTLPAFHEALFFQQRSDTGVRVRVLAPGTLGDRRQLSCAIPLEDQQLGDLQGNGDLDGEDAFQYLPFDVGECGRQQAASWVRQVLGHQVARVFVEFQVAFAGGRVVEEDGGQPADVPRLQQVAQQAVVLFSRQVAEEENDPLEHRFLQKKPEFQGLGGQIVRGGVFPADQSGQPAGKSLVREIDIQQQGLRVVQVVEQVVTGDGPLPGMLGIDPDFGVGAGPQAVRGSGAEQVGGEVLAAAQVICAVGKRWRAIVAECPPAIARALTLALEKGNDGAGERQVLGFQLPAEAQRPRRQDLERRRNPRNQCAIPWRPPEMPGSAARRQRQPAPAAARERRRGWG